ncbi:hypothetical protein [Oceaniglobus roseus]|uniref:hypothetical protein n=1 Tax=Oceaniglobus roseus TaxID=1737570 RepID=UPI0013000AD2|nr:hypothetical protein [Kandeliimicrobium roseum]
MSQFRPFRLLRLAFLSALLAIPLPVGAETFRAMLGGRTLGTISFDAAGSGAGRTARLLTNLNNTPLGVGDGTFEALSESVSANGRRLRQYTGTSRSARKSRDIAVLLDGGRVIQTTVSPADEQTPLSDAAKVPAGVIDLAQGFGRIVDSQGCPQGFRMYDGRRVIQVSPGSAETKDDLLTCSMSYNVVAGPGHLSPFRFTNLSLDLTYDARPGRTGLLRAVIRTGLFALTLQR